MIGLYGGSFDPIHLGHLHAARVIQKNLNLDSIFFIPTGVHPFAKKFTATVDQRLAMCHLALKNEAHFMLDESEVAQTTPGYAIDTVRRYQRNYPREKIALIIGSDAALDFHQWHEWEILQQEVSIIVMRRQTDVTHNEDAIHTIIPNAIFIDINPINISSTRLRKELATHHELNTFLPPDVWQYICTQHLYGVRACE